MKATQLSSVSYAIRVDGSNVAYLIVHGYKMCRKRPRAPAGKVKCKYLHKEDCLEVTRSIETDRVHVFSLLTVRRPHLEWTGGTYPGEQLHATVVKISRVAAIVAVVSADRTHRGMKHRRCL